MVVNLFLILKFKTTKNKMNELMCIRIGYNSLFLEYIDTITEIMILS